MGTETAHILIVDDELSMREFLEMLLSREGYRITCAEIEGSVESCNELSGDVTVTMGEAPVISDLGVTVNPFSPDDDGDQDTTTVSFDLNADADVTIVVEDSKTLLICRESICFSQCNSQFIETLERIPGIERKE